MEQNYEEHQNGYGHSDYGQQQQQQPPPQQPQFRPITSAPQYSAPPQPSQQPQYAPYPMYAPSPYPQMQQQMTDPYSQYVSQYHQPYTDPVLYQQYNQKNGLNLQFYLQQNAQLMSSHPYQNGMPCRSLYIGNLSEKVTDGLMYDIFGMMGAIESCKVCKDKATGQSAGYGFVDYYDPRVAALALSQLSGRKIYGVELKVNWAFNTLGGGTKEDTSGHYHLFVGDISPEVDDKALFNAFNVFGSLSDAKVMMDPAQPGKSRGYGFVAFRKKEDAQRALSEMNGEWLGTKAIRCNWANQRGPMPGMDGEMDSNKYGSSSSSSSSSRDSGRSFGGRNEPQLDYSTVLTQASISNTSVYVGGVTADISSDMLQSAFKDYGTIEEVRLQPDKGFAFIRYQTHENAAKAIVGMNNKMVGNRIMRCSWGKERTPSTFGSSSGGSGSSSGLGTRY